MRRLTSLPDLELTTTVATMKSEDTPYKAEVLAMQGTRASQSGEPGADEDMQSHFPIHLGCTKMN